MFEIFRPPFKVKKLQTPGGTSTTCPSLLNLSGSFVDLVAWENALHPFDFNIVIVDSPNKLDSKNSGVEIFRK